jgi:hypothetical protein
MVETTFKSTSISEFNKGLIEKIRSKNKTKFIESQAETNRRIEQAIEETERGENLISFTGEEYEALVKQLSIKKAV